MKLTPRDLARLAGVHTDLVRVINGAAGITHISFMVLEGLRTPGRQAELLNKGATTTMNSRHLTGHAVDIAPMVGGDVRWDWPLYYELAKVIKEAAKIEDVVIEWGGDWKKFKDGPHWQLPHRLYPVNKGD